MNIFPEHELKVAYPFGGERFIIRWYSHNEGHHIIVALSKKSAEEIFKSVLEKEADTQCKDFLVVNIVAPPKEYCEKYAKEQFNSDVHVFWDIYVSTAHDYYARENKLPAKMKWCSGFVAKYEGDEEGEYPPHYNCKNCVSKIMPVKGTFEEFYLLSREKYLAKYPKHYNKDLYVSKADAYDPNEKLYLATPNFGHHCSGIELKESVRYIHWDRAHLFFYQSPKEVDRAVIDSMLKKVKEEWKKWKEQKDKDWEEAKKQREMREFKELLEFFG